MCCFWSCRGRARWSITPFWIWICTSDVGRQLGALPCFQIPQNNKTYADIYRPHLHCNRIAGWIHRTMFFWKQPNRLFFRETPSFSSTNHIVQKFLVEWRSKIKSDLNVVSPDFPHEFGSVWRCSAGETKADAVLTPQCNHRRLFSKQRRRLPDFFCAMRDTRTLQLNARPACTSWIAPERRQGSYWWTRPVTGQIGSKRSSGKTLAWQSSNLACSSKSKSFECLNMPGIMMTFWKGTLFLKSNALLQALFLDRITSVSLKGV